MITNARALFDHDHGIDGAGRKEVTFVKGQLKLQPTGAGDTPNREKIRAELPDYVPAL